MSGAFHSKISIRQGFLSIILTGLLCSWIGDAAAKKIKFESAYDIPFGLQKILESNYHHDSFINAASSRMVFFTGKRDKFVKADLEYAIEKALIDKKSLAVQNWIKYEVNFDGVITLEEMYRRGRDTMPGRIEKGDPSHQTAMQWQMKRSDLNKDGVISLEEMSHINLEDFEKEKGKIKTEFNSYFECDLNEDGILEVAEIKEVAEAVFSFYDRDNNLKISRKELGM